MVNFSYILVFPEFPRALVYYNQFSGRLSIDRGLARLRRTCPPLFLSAIFVAEWRAGLLTISWLHHSKAGKFKV
jgi:hypothetical protein